MQALITKVGLVTIIAQAGTVENGRVEVQT